VWPSTAAAERRGGPFCSRANRAVAPRRSYADQFDHLVCRRPRACSGAQSLTESKARCSEHDGLFLDASESVNTMWLQKKSDEVGITHRGQQCDARTDLQARDLEPLARPGWTAKSIGSSALTSRSAPTSSASTSGIDVRWSVKRHDTVLTPRDTVAGRTSATLTRGSTQSSESIITFPKGGSVPVRWLLARGLRLHRRTARTATATAGP